MIKVLIADDEPLVRAGIKTVLPWNMYGFDVISEAADGKEAYEKILKLKPDILITDIKMPGMDGITLLKRLKQEKISIQSLVLSCFDEFELVREAMKYGAHDYIRKLSIDPAKLLEVLKEMKEAISDQPEKNASFSLNTDDLKYLFIKRLQNQGFEDHEQVKNVLHNIKLDISIQDYHLIRFSFEPDTAPITDTNRKNLIYNLLNQICVRYPGQELFSLDEKGYLLISNTKKDLLLCRQIGAAMKQYANQTVYFGISPLLKDETSFKAGMKQAEEALSACIFYERSEPLPYPLLTSVGFPFITDSQAQELYIALSSGNSEKSSELVQRFLLWLKSGLFYPFQCYSYMEEILNIFIRVARELNFSLYQMTADENDIYSYGFAFTSSDLDDAVKSLADILPDMLKLAETEKACQLMAAEIEKTRRRVNALEHVIIPRAQENIKYITMKLDENERSTQIRLMKVKDMMLEEAHHYKERQAAAVVE